MKARIKKTGEIINIADYARIDLDVCDSYGNPISVSPNEIELISENNNSIYWEQRRYEIAKTAMQGILSNQDQVNYACSKVNHGNRPYALSIAVAQYAIACADALIDELKR